MDNTVIIAFQNILFKQSEHFLKHLNIVKMGSKNGTLTQRIIHVILTKKYLFILKHIKCLGKYASI